MKNVSLVLEGGGFRCSYLAGCLTWLMDNNIEFKFSTSVSSGAAAAFFYHGNDKKKLHDFTVDEMLDKKLIGIHQLVKEGGLVGYQYMIDKYVMPSYPQLLKNIKNQKVDMEICVYNTLTSTPEYFNQDAFGDNATILKASCVLPISGKMVEYQGQKYLDGGTEIMIPIQRAIDQGYEKHLIIVTKGANYVRKPNPIYLRILFDIIYHKYPGLRKTLFNRHINYYNQMDVINNLVAENKALLMRPSDDCGVGRFSGNKENMEKLFNTGYNDMENRKEEILSFLK